MKTADYIKTMLPVYWSDGVGSNYAITKIYDLHLKNCLVEVTDIMYDNTHDVRLKSDWITKPLHPLQTKKQLDLFSGEVGDGIILKDEVIEMIDINFFDKFD